MILYTWRIGLHRFVWRFQKCKVINRFYQPIRVYIDIFWQCWIFVVFFFNFKHPFKCNLAFIHTFFDMVPSYFIESRNNTQIWTGLTLRIPLIYRSVQFGQTWRSAGSGNVPNLLIPCVQYIIYNGEILCPREKCLEMLPLML